MRRVSPFGFALVLLLGACASGSSSRAHLAIGNAPMVLAKSARGNAPVLSGGTIPREAEYILTEVVRFHASEPGSAPSSPERFQERLRYSGTAWEAIFLNGGSHARWGGTFATRGNVLTSKVAFGARTGEILVDSFEADAQRLIVQFAESRE